MKETLTLKAKEARSIAYGDHELFEDVVSTITSVTRWSICYEKIIKRISDGVFFKMNYRVGATEMQDESPYEWEDEVSIPEVFPVEKTIIVYE
jgi:hypothetical protein